MTDGPTDCGIVNPEHRLSTYLALRSRPFNQFTELVLARASKMLNGTGIRIFTGASLPRLV